MRGFPCKLYDADNPDWAPSLKLGYDAGTSSKSRERYERAVERVARKRAIDESEVYSVPEESVIKEGGSYSPVENCAAVQTA